MDEDECARGTARGDAAGEKETSADASGLRFETKLALSDASPRPVLAKRSEKNGSQKSIPAAVYLAAVFLARLPCDGQGWGPQEETRFIQQPGPLQISSRAACRVSVLGVADPQSCCSCVHTPYGRWIGSIERH
jgi:hypothetical protein